MTNPFTNRRCPCLCGRTHQRCLWEYLFKRHFINGFTYLLTLISLPLPRRLCNRHCFVCLLATLCKNFQTDLHEICREGRQWAREQIMKRWWQSRSRIQIWIRWSFCQPTQSVKVQPTTEIFFLDSPTHSRGEGTLYAGSLTSLPLRCTYDPDINNPTCLWTQACDRTVHILLLSSESETVCSHVRGLEHGDKRGENFLKH